MNYLRPPETAPDDLRVGHYIGRKVAEGAAPRAVLIGFPTDEGVRRNGGRPGAAAGPAEIRRYLARLTPDARAGQPFIELLEHTQDLGDVAASGVLEADQERLAAQIAEHLERDVFVVVLGGGHETAYGHFLGYVRAGRQVSILNWDAHPDVRELKHGLGHSGSPFRQALLHPSKLCRGYEVAGLLPQSTAAAHLAFIAERRGRAVWRDELTPERIAALYETGPTMVTFDIDAVDQSQAPGVSAPASGGMSSDLWLAAAAAAGKSLQVKSCELVELNPNYDRDGQTARLAALTIWNILRGVALRGSPPQTTQRSSRRSGRRRNNNIE
jgi:formiminoglutamase